MAGFGRMHEKLVPVLASVEAILRPMWPDFPDAADDDPAVTVGESRTSVQKGAVDTIGEGKNGIGFNAQNLTRQVVSALGDGWIWFIGS